MAPPCKKAGKPPKNHRSHESKYEVQLSERNAVSGTVKSVMRRFLSLSELRRRLTKKTHVERTLQVLLNVPYGPKCAAPY